MMLFYASLKDFNTYLQWQISVVAFTCAYMHILIEIVHEKIMYHKIQLN